VVVPKRVLHSVEKDISRGEGVLSVLLIAKFVEDEEDVDLKFL
jgi:hypothetical protein